MTLALIAGTGDLPPALIDRLDTRPLVCAMEGHGLQVTPDLTFRIEHLGSLIEKLLDRGVTQVCMAGAVRRPKIDAGAINDATRPLVPRIMAAIGKGDDGALREIIAIFEDAGLDVRAAHELAPDLLPSTGMLVGVAGADAAADAVSGERTLVAMGLADLGQACVIRRGRVLAREDDAGTDAMLMRLDGRDSAGLFDPLGLVGDAIDTAAEWLSGPQGDPVDARGAILFKAPKPHQDRRADLPVIGARTANLAAAAGLSGIVIEAGGVMVLDLSAVRRTLADHGMFLWVRPKGGA